MRPGAICPTWCLHQNPNDPEPDMSLDCDKWSFVKNPEFLSRVVGFFFISASLYRGPRNALQNKRKKLI